MIATIDTASTPAMTTVRGLTLMVCVFVLIKPERIDGPSLECGDSSLSFRPRISALSETNLPYTHVLTSFIALNPRPDRL